MFEMERKIMDDQNILEELKEAHKNYKKGNYPFGKYATGDQIRKAFMDGKTFVLKGPGQVFLVPLLGPIVTMVPFLIIGSLSREYFGLTLIIFSIAMAIFEPFLLIIYFSVRRQLVVIGPSGVYYRRFISNGFFEWKNVIHTYESIKTIDRGYKSPSYTTAQVTVKLTNNEEVFFDSVRYGNKEFDRKAKRVLFISLFLTYYALATDAINRSRYV
jgi:hypothetical protein